MTLAAMKRLSLAILAATVVAVLPARADEWSKTYNLSGKPDLRIETSDANIRVTTWDQHTIEAKVVTTHYKIGEDGIRVEERQNGDSVEIDVRYPHHNFNVEWGQHRVDIIIQMPREGRINLRTGDGKIDVAGLKGEMDLHTGDGSENLEAVDGKLHASTGDGHITAHGRFDELELKTGDGHVEVRAAGGSSLAAGWRLETGDGNVSLEVPGELAADVDLHTSDGHIDLDMPITTEGKIRQNEIRGKLNGGGSLLTIRTGDGSIHLRKGLGRHRRSASGRPQMYDMRFAARAYTFGSQHFNFISNEGSSMEILRINLVGLTVACLLSLATAQSPTEKSQPALDVTSMDQSVDPCVDFFAYSCGGWIKRNPIPPDQSSWDTYSKMQDENLGRLRGILEATATPDPKRNAVDQKIGDYYASCTDEKAIDAKGAEPLKPSLERIAKISSKPEIADVAAAMIDDNVLFRFDSIQDFRDANQVIANADQGGLGLPDRDYYTKDDAKSVDLRKQYLAHVQKMFELLGDKPETAATEAQTVMRIETALAKGSMTRVERRDPKALDHKMTSTELENISPKFHWPVYFAKVGIPSLASLNVASPNFFKALNEELEKESLADWKIYLRWHLAHADAPYLAAPFLNENFAFYGKALRGQQELKPRWKRCTQGVDDDLGEALGQAYVAKYFPPEAKQQALKIVKEVQAAMQQDISGLPWMSPATKQQALAKLQGMANKIGYPDKWRDYSKLEIVRGDEMGNVERARKFEFDRQLAKIGKPVDRGEWAMTPPTVNAYYDPQMNDINFPAGVLQPPAFDPKSDAAPNYGDTGGTVGHELTHGFDDEGRQFDAQGNLRDWWTEQDGKEFVKRASCISDQYSTYTIIDDIKINGKLTLGEDVADLGGLILAYMAWKDDTKGQTLDPLDGLTPDQRFFVGYGQSWCGQTRDETKRLRATVDPHSPEKYRTNGVVSNMPQFQEAFHCKAGSPMVNQNRCSVW